MNKKAVAIKGIIQFIYKVIYAAFVLASVVFLIKLLVFTSVPTEELDVHSFANRIMNSKDIMYTDPITQRLYPGIIDKSKLGKDTLEKAFVVPNNKMAAKLTVYYGNKTSSDEFIFNERLYDQLKPYIIAGVEGSSGATFWKYHYPIQYHDAGVFNDGTFVITIVRQND